MSELLENLASCLPAAAEASKRLRAYIAEIDRFLEPLQSSSSLRANAVQNLDGVIPALESSTEETVVPLELLQRIPWDWGEQMQTF